MTISPLTEFMVRDDFSNAELAGRFGLPVGYDVTATDPLSNALGSQIYTQQVLAAGRFAAEQLAANAPPDIAQLEIELHENHPTTKPVFYGGAPATLTPGYEDNNLFHITPDGRIWFGGDPQNTDPHDFEAAGDANGDNIYQIEFIRDIAGNQFTTRLDITLNDILLERLTSDINTGVETRIHQSSDYAPSDLPSLAAQQIMSPVYWDSPDDGPLVLTWSIDDGDIDPSLITRYGDVITTETSNAIENQAQLDAVRLLFQRAFNDLEAFVNIKFIEVDVNPNTGQTGDLNVHVVSNLEQVTFGLGEFPGIDRSDIFISNRVAETDWLDIDSLEDFNLEFASFLRNGTLHEIGHALGLSHPFDEIENYWPGDPSLRDSPRTFMSYRTSLDHVAAGAKEVDLVALQWLYGAPGEDGTGAEFLEPPTIV